MRTYLLVEIRTRTKAEAETAVEALARAACDVGNSYENTHVSVSDHPAPKPRKA